MNTLNRFGKDMELQVLYGNASKMLDSLSFIEQLEEETSSSAPAESLSASPESVAVFNDDFMVLFLQLSQNKNLRVEFIPRCLDRGAEYLDSCIKGFQDLELPEEEDLKTRDLMVSMLEELKVRFPDSRVRPCDYSPVQEGAAPVSRLQG